MSVAKLKPKGIAPREEIVVARQMHQALVLHFLEGLTQAQIADQLGISHATVNRLIKRGRQLGLVEIKIKSPVEPLVDLEERLLGIGGISRAVVVPTVSDNPQTALLSVGRQPPECFSKRLPMVTRFASRVEKASAQWSREFKRRAVSMSRLFQQRAVCRKTLY